MLKIRDMTEDDRDSFIPMVIDFYRGGATLYEANVGYISQTFDAVIQHSPYLRAVIIQQDDITVGYALLAFTWSNESGGRVVWLEQLYIKPEFRGKTIGSHFLQWLQEEYRTFSRIRLEVCSSNPDAKRLYEKYGFHTLDYIQMVYDR